MGLLWVQAMPWWSGRPEHGYEKNHVPWWDESLSLDDINRLREGEPTPLRDPSEEPSDRHTRHVNQVTQVHGVSPEAAHHAVEQVRGHLDQGVERSDPVDYGFASQKSQVDNYAPHEMDAIQNPRTWNDRAVENVPTKEIHATQNFLRPASIAHNLFHPGKQEPAWEPEATGDPDYNPSWSRGQESDDVQDADPAGMVRFVRNDDGSVEVADGHHRVAADLLLGKSHTRGKVVPRRELG